MFMLGYAYQLGALPLSAEAIEKAIEMNGEAVAMNIAAFRYGRRAALDPRRGRGAGQARAGARDDDSLKLSQSFDETVERRVAFLTAYQNARYARRYRALGREDRKRAEADQGAGRMRAAEAVARYLFKLMAYKDEYEVARLYTDTLIPRARALDLRRRQPALRISAGAAAVCAPRQVTGEPKKCHSGPGCLGALGVLKKFKVLRGTPLDPFGYTAERRAERKLIVEYEKLLADIAEHLTPGNYNSAVALAALPEKIRGYGPVKQRHLGIVKAEEAGLYEHFRAGSAPFLKAAE